MLADMSRQILAPLMTIAVLAAAVVDFARAATKDTNLGTAVSPAHFPNFSDRDLHQFFKQAAQIGSHVTLIVEWESMPPMPAFKIIHDLAAQKDLKFHLYLSPIALFGGRKTPAIPKSVGGASFSDPAVRAAYKEQVLTLAAIGPDYLGLATEVNFLAQNPPELAAFASLTREAYKAVKEKYPEQTVTLSFQWDVMRAHKQFDILQQFAGSIDVYSFTSYPDAFGDPTKVKVPANYFSSVREVLPTQRVGFSEVGWSSAPPSSEEQQAEFLKRLPEFVEGAGFEFVTLALLHDVTLFTGELERLNHVGIRHVDDSPKKAWDVILNLPELR